MTEGLAERLCALLSGDVRAALLVSGQGSNAISIISNAWRYPRITFPVIVTDQDTSGATAVAKLARADSVHIPFGNREAFFSELAHTLQQRAIRVVLYAGFMKIAPAWFVTAFPGLNVHPADLSIRDPLTGRPILVGMNCIVDAVAAGHTRLACTVHVVDAEVDCGLPLLVFRGQFAPPGEIGPAEVRARHNRIKHLEHTAYPLALLLLSNAEIALKNAPYVMEISQNGA